MPTVSKILALLIIPVMLVYLWLAASVLEARRRWDAKVQAKAEEARQVAAEVEGLANGTPEVLGPGGDFEKLAEIVLRNASDVARKEFRDNINQGIEPRVAFELAFAKFVDQKAIEDFQQAVNRLNELQKSPTIDESQLGGALKAYGDAENVLKQQRTNLDNAYFTFLGQVLGQPSVRDLFTKGGLGIEPMKSTISRVQRSIIEQKAVFETLKSDGDNAITLWKDLVAGAVDQANQMAAAAKAAQAEDEARSVQVAELTNELKREQEALKEAEQLRDEMIAAYEDLSQRFAKATAASQRLVAQVKEWEIRVDARRTGRPAVLSPNGLIPKGTIQRIDEKDGTLYINLGARVGVRPGAQLHVYRFEPEAKYLGLMEVTTSDSDSASGRMLPEYRQRDVWKDDSVSPEIVPPTAKTTP